MTNDEIIQIARRAYKSCEHIPNVKIPPEFIERFAKLVAQHEREALEQSVATCLDQYSHEQVRSRPEHFINQAITAIKAALEAKDEPVACKECHLKDTVYDLLDDLKVANLKLSVRSQRTWVGLTIEEISAIDWKSNETLHDFARAIEAKLKERNT